jgi:hypothetical protein
MEPLETICIAVYTKHCSIHFCGGLFIASQTSTVCNAFYMLDILGIGFAPVCVWLIISILTIVFILISVLVAVVRIEPRGI